jgi:hypothetical protein
MTGIVHAESRDRARGTQIGIACELRCKPGGAVPERTMDGGPRIRAELGDPGFSDLHPPAFCNPLPAARDGPLTDGAAACQYTIRFVRVPELTAEPARQRDEPPGNPMLRAVAEGTRDDRGGGCRTSWRNAAVRVWVAATPSARNCWTNAPGGEGLAGASAGEQPQAGGVGGRVHIRAVGSQLGQHRGKRGSGTGSEGRRGG